MVESQNGKWKSFSLFRVDIGKLSTQKTTRKGTFPYAFCTVFLDFTFHRFFFLLLFFGKYKFYETLWHNAMQNCKSSVGKINRSQIIVHCKTSGIFLSQVSRISMHILPSICIAIHSLLYRTQPYNVGDMVPSIYVPARNYLHILSETFTQQKKNPIHKFLS